MIRYDYNTFKNIEGKVVDKINIYGNNLRQNTLKKLLIQSKNNKTIKEKPKDENTWVSKSLNFNNNILNNRSKMNQSLNKLTDKNKTKLFTEILEIIKLDINLTNIIYIKSKEQDYYSEIFAELCRYIYVNTNNNNFLKILLDNIESDFNNRLKKYYKGNILFFSNLYKHNIITLDTIKFCIDNIINNINNQSVSNELIDQEIQSLYNIFNITKFNSDFKNFKLLKSLTSNKEQIVNSKSRFKLLDIIELISEK
jgi:hypothetical protein